MLLAVGTQERLIIETTSGPGQTEREGSILSDALLVSLYVGSIAGTLSVSVDTIQDNGQYVTEFTYPLISSPTPFILQRKTGVKLQRFRIVVTYTGIASYEVYVRAISNSGESSTRILGSADWETDQVTVGTSPTLLIAAALVDRNGVVLKNWSNAANVYVAESSAKLLASKGYPLAARDGLALDISAGAEVWAMSDTPGADMRLAQSGGT